MSGKKNKKMRFTYKEVCEILCDGCKHGLPSLYTGSPFRKIEHCVNKEKITCNAEKWRLDTTNKEKPYEDKK